MAMPRKPASWIVPPSAASLGNTTIRAAWLWLLVLLLLAGVPSVSGAASASDTHAEIRQHTAKLATARAKIAAATKSLAQARGRQTRLQRAVNAVEKRIVRARGELATVHDKVRVVDARLAATDKKRASVRAQLAHQRGVLAAQLRAQYMLGGGGDHQLQLLLSTRDPSLTGRLLADYGYLQKARSAAIAAIQSQLHELADLETQIHAQQQSLTKLKARREHTLAGLQGAQDKRARAIAALKAKIGRKGEELDVLRASEKRMKALLSSLADQLSSVPYEAGNSRPFPKLRGRLPWPVRGSVLAHYGAPRAGGPLKWKGTWIAARQGAPVRASARGRVVYVGWVSSYGLIVLLQHDDGYFTLYGHAASAGVQLGETVTAGEKIATAGKTGGYSRSGVYFEIRHRGRALDPARWLKH